MRAVADKVVIELLPAEERYGSLVIPARARQRSSLGRVVAVGPGVLPVGEREYVGLDVREGDLVLYGSNNRQYIFKVGEIEYKTIREIEIYCVVKENVDARE